MQINNEVRAIALSLKRMQALLTTQCIKNPYSIHFNICVLGFCVCVCSIASFIFYALSGYDGGEKSIDFYV